jgi:hypothetical protein
MSIKNSNNTIGNRSHDLRVCSTVPQPLRHRVPLNIYLGLIILYKNLSLFLNILCPIKVNNTKKNIPLVLLQMTKQRYSSQQICAYVHVRLNRHLGIREFWTSFYMYCVNLHTRNNFYTPCETQPAVSDLYQCHKKLNVPTARIQQREETWNIKQNKTWAHSYPKLNSITTLK